MTTLFAIVDAGAAAVLQPGQAFTTAQLLLQTAEDVAEFGGTIGDVVDHTIGHAANALALFTDADRARYRIQTVTIPTAPDGKVEGSHTLVVGGDGTIAYDAVWIDAPAAPVPEQVSAVQLLEQIRRDGRTAAVNTYVAGAGDDVQLWFSRAVTVRRDNAMLTTGWAALSLTSDQLDATFRAAAQIPL